MDKPNEVIDTSNCYNAGDISAGQVSKPLSSWSLDSKQREVQRKGNSPGVKSQPSAALPIVTGTCNCITLQ